MHRVVLLLGGVKVLGVLVNSILTEHVLEEKETVVVRIVESRCVVEDTNV